MTEHILSGQDTGESLVFVSLCLNHCIQHCGGCHQQSGRWSTECQHLFWKTGISGSKYNSELTSSSICINDTKPKSTPHITPCNHALFRHVVSFLVVGPTEALINMSFAMKDTLLVKCFDSRRFAVYNDQLGLCILEFCCWYVNAKL